MESAGMKRYLKELKPTELEDLIAMVALYRPGPMEYLPAYIKRKHKLERVTYLHPKLEPILSPTYGIGVYQEQMMQIARDLAGFTLPEADTLRKAIGKKIKSLLNEQHDKLVAGMIKNGIRPNIAEAKTMGLEVLPPDVNESFETFTVISASAENNAAKIRFGLSAIKNVGSNIVDAIIAARKLGG